MIDLTDDQIESACTELRGVSQQRRNAMCTKYPLLGVFLAFEAFFPKWRAARSKRC